MHIRSSKYTENLKKYILQFKNEKKHENKNFIFN